MTAPMLPMRGDEDPLDALKALKAQRAAPDPLDELKATRQSAPKPPAFAAESTGALARNRPDATGDFEATVPAVLGHIANVAQGIPGVEAAEAGARSLVRRQPYREALSDIRGQTDKIPPVLRTVERMAGGAPLAAVLPGSAAVSGALIGGADEALSANPDESLGTRAAKTVAGAGVGALAGKVGEKVVTAGKALLPKMLGGVGEGADAALIRMQGDRAASASRLYNRALAEGHQGEVSPAIHDFLAEPDIAPIVERIQSGRTGSQMETPELLDRVYKELSDMQKQATKSLGALDPSKPNAAVSRLADIKAAKLKFLKVVSSPTQKPPLTLDVAPEVTEVEPRITPEREPMAGPVSDKPLAATTTAPPTTLSQGLRNVRGGAPNEMQGPGGPAFQLGRQSQVVKPGVRIETPGMRVQTAPAEDVPALMPSYEDAVNDFAKRTKEIDALKRGYGTLKQKGTGDLPPVSALGRKTPLSLQEWAKSATPEQINAARQGVLGGVRDATALGGKTLSKGRLYNAAAAPILRKLPTQSQHVTDMLQNLGLLTAGNQITTP